MSMGGAQGDTRVGERPDVNMGREEIHITRGEDWFSVTCSEGGAQCYTWVGEGLRGVLEDPHVTHGWGKARCYSWMGGGAM